MPALAPPEDRLYSSLIGIAGGGGLGSNLALHLCRMGFKNLLIADFDIVCPGNLNRQFFFAAQEGMNKTDALKKNLDAVFPGRLSIKTVTERISSGNAAEIFKDCRVFADCTDRAETKSEIVAAILSSLQCPAVSASGIGGRLTPALTSTRELFGGRLTLVGDGETAEDKGTITTSVCAAAAVMAENIYRYCREEIKS